MSTETHKTKLLSVVGPTASGKTSLSIKLAQRFNGEVISADSRQIYRKLDIGTAKVTEEEMDGVPHHLIDIIDIDQTYSAAQFQTDATQAIHKIVNNGHLPIIAGGTFFYVDTLLGRTSAPEVPPNPELRETLDLESTQTLMSILEAKDPRRAADIDQNNRRRLIRALEIIEALGHVPTITPATSPYDVYTIGIETNKETLRDRFIQRGRSWLQNGFAEEVQQLLADNIDQDRLREIGFEYTLMVQLLNEELTEDEFLEKFVQKNWQYAKRQIMWLKRDENVHWYSHDDPAIFDEVQTFLD